MPIPTPGTGRVPPCARPTPKTTIRKQARVAKSAARAAVDAAVAAALHRPSRERAVSARAERLAAALSTTSYDPDRLIGDLLPWRFALRWFQITRPPEAFRVAADVVVEIERRAPGLALGRVHDRAGIGCTLTRLGELSSSFVRPLSTWQPPRRRPAKVLDHLLGHLFHRFKTPAPLHVLMTDPGRPSILATTLVDVAGGRSWRSLGLPTVINRAVAHALSTPRDDVTTAMGLIRDAQCRALGMGPGHRAAVIDADGGDFLDDEEGFFEHLAFIARHRDLTVAEVKTICEGLAVMPGQNADKLPSTKGRTPRSLLAACHEAIRFDAARNDGRIDVGPLPPSTVDGGRYVVTSVPEWDAPEFVVEPLRTGLALVEEGHAMRHCVGTYAERAKSGDVVIVGLRRLTSSGSAKRALTLEVQLSVRRVVQVRGKGNRRATDVEQAVVRCWADEARLIVGSEAF